MLVVVTLVVVDIAASSGISPACAAIVCTAALVNAALSTSDTSRKVAAVTRR